MNDQERAAWLGFLYLHATLTDEVDRELRDAHGLRLVHCEAMTHLHRAPDNRLRMSELASMLCLAQSGATRLVDALERRGYVGRHRCLADGRVQYAQLSESGKALVQEAHPTHIAAVRSRFLSALDKPMLSGYAAVWEQARRAAISARPP